MPRPRLTALVESLPAFVPFVGPEAQERARGRPFRARLGANESLFGPSPKAIAAMQAAAAGNWMYADPESYELRAALARFHGVGIDNVVIGEGIDGLLGPRGEARRRAGLRRRHLGRHLSDLQLSRRRRRRAPRARALSRRPPGSRRAARRGRARGRAHPLRLQSRQPDGLVLAGADALQELIARLPDGLLLCLDEAYCDTAPPTSCCPSTSANAQVLRLRTFSKAYGLAGARIGYCLGEASADPRTSRRSAITTASTASDRSARSPRSRTRTISPTPWHASPARASMIGDIAAANGLEPLPSAANFVTIDCGGDGAFAKRVLDGLLARDVFVRMPGVAPLNRCIRVSCGRDEDLEPSSPQRCRGALAAASDEICGVRVDSKRHAREFASR